MVYSCCDKSSQGGVAIFINRRFLKFHRVWYCEVVPGRCLAVHLWSEDAWLCLGCIHLVPEWDVSRKRYVLQRLSTACPPQGKAISFIGGDWNFNCDDGDHIKFNELDC
eukprot:3757662-Karenia_brevis.AAC.1